MLTREDMKAKQEGKIDIKRWAIRKEPELCRYIRTACARSERDIKQQMIYMMKQYIKMEKEPERQLETKIVEPRPYYFDPNSPLTSGKKGKSNG